MAGNVWGWVSDWYLGTYYLNSPASNPLGPELGITLWHVVAHGVAMNTSFVQLIAKTGQVQIQRILTFNTASAARKMRNDNTYTEGDAGKLCTWLCGLICL